MSGRVLKFRRNGIGRTSWNMPISSHLYERASLLWAVDEAAFNRISHAVTVALQQNGWQGR